MNAQPIREEHQGRGRRFSFSAARDWLLGHEYEEYVVEEDSQEQIQPEQEETMEQPKPDLRYHAPKYGRVAVRRNAQVFDDAKAAADGLKEGEQQIVNLERATPLMSERIIDFLNGVCYALDGSVEKVGEKVYMFVPHDVQVEVDEGQTVTPQSHTSSTRRSQYE